MTKEQILLAVKIAIEKNTDKSPMGLAYEQGFEDGANYALQKLEQCDVMRWLEYPAHQPTEGQLIVMNFDNTTFCTNYWKVERLEDFKPYQKFSYAVLPAIV